MNIIKRILYSLLFLFGLFLPLIISGGIPVYDAAAFFQRKVTLSRQIEDLMIQTYLKGIEEYWNNFDLNTFIFSQGIKVVPRYWLSPVNFESLGTWKYLSAFVPDSLQSKLNYIYDTSYGGGPMVNEKHSYTLYNNLISVIGYPRPMPLTADGFHSMPSSVWSNSAINNSEYIKDSSSTILNMQSTAIAEGYAYSASYMNASQNLERRYKEWAGDVASVNSNKYADEKAYLKLIVSFMNMIYDQYQLELKDRALSARQRSAQLTGNYNEVLEQVNTRREPYSIVSSIKDDFIKEEGTIE